jgi:hypothetical protein
MCVPLRSSLAQLPYHDDAAAINSEPTVMLSVVSRYLHFLFHNKNSVVAYMDPGVWKQRTVSSECGTHYSYHTVIHFVYLGPRYLVDVATRLRVGRLRNQVWIPVRADQH